MLASLKKRLVPFVTNATALLLLGTTSFAPSMAVAQDAPPANAGSGLQANNTSNKLEPVYNIVVDDPFNSLSKTNRLFSITNEIFKLNTNDEKVVRAALKEAGQEDLIYFLKAIKGVADNAGQPDGSSRNVAHLESLRSDPKQFFMHLSVRAFLMEGIERKASIIQDKENRITLSDAALIVMPTLMWYAEKEAFRIVVADASNDYKNFVGSQDVGNKPYVTDEFINRIYKASNDHYRPILKSCFPRINFSPAPKDALTPR